MTTPLPPALSSFAPIPGTVKTKRVLLVDCSQAKGELRPEVMKRLGVDVDCIAEARSCWRATLYDLVLINREDGAGYRDRFCHQVRTAAPPRWSAFLFGQPEYRADSPHTDEESCVQNADDQIVGGLKVTFAADRGDLAHDGIFELHGKSPQSEPRPSPAPERCAPCRLRPEILKDVYRNQRRHRTTWMIY